MADPHEPVSFRDDELFRKGACHGAAWFLETIRTLAAQGRSADEICQHLEDLTKVLAEWRTQMNALPDGNPWDWSFKDLASVIKAGDEH